MSRPPCFPGGNQHRRIIVCWWLVSQVPPFFPAWESRLVQWAQATQLTVELVYYPPYHSKYNPIERFWGVLEVYWNGELLDSEEAVLGFAANLTYAGRHPHVDRVSAAYCSGVRRSRAEKKLLEGQLMRQPSLPKWSVTIARPKPDEIIFPA